MSKGSDNEISIFQSLVVLNMIVTLSCNSLRKRDCEDCELQLEWVSEGVVRDTLRSSVYLAYCCDSCVRTDSLSIIQDVNTFLAGVSMNTHVSDIHVYRKCKIFDVFEPQSQRWERIYPFHVITIELDDCRKPILFKHREGNKIDYVGKHWYNFPSASE